MMELICKHRHVVYIFFSFCDLRTRLVPQYDFEILHSVTLCACIWWIYIFKLSFLNCPMLESVYWARLIAEQLLVFQKDLRISNVTQGSIVAPCTSCLLMSLHLVSINYWRGEIIQSIPENSRAKYRRSIECQRVWTTNHWRDKGKNPPGNSDP